VRIRAWVKDKGLRLHTDKTHIGDCRNRGEGFEFLGYRFEAGGRYVRKKSLNRLKDSIRAKTRRLCGKASRALSKASAGRFRDGSITSNTRITALDQFIRRGCVQSRASRRSGPASARRTRTIANGLVLLSHKATGRSV